MKQVPLSQVPLEKTVVKAITQFLRARGAYVVKQHGSQFSTAGVPDLICCYKGHFLAVEVKRNHPSCKVSLVQKKHLNDVSDRGGIALVARSVDDVESALVQIDNKEKCESD